MPVFGWSGGQFLQVNSPKLCGEREEAPDSSYDLHLAIALGEAWGENVEGCSDTTERSQGVIPADRLLFHSDRSVTVVALQITDLVLGSLLIFEEGNS